MDEHKPLRPITPAQVAGILASTLALFFMVAFATKSVDAYRLRNWRDQLQSELDAMKREHQELQVELQRRQSTAWVESVLRDAGQIAAGDKRVEAIGVTPSPGATPTPFPQATPAPIAPSSAWFANPNWKAWQRLLWGFD